MTASSVRCPNCGKRVPISSRSCPACGSELALHVERIRCNYCGRRVPAQVHRCPSCDHNPRRWYLRPRHLGYVVALLVFALLLYGSFKSPAWLAALALSATPTPAPLAVPAIPSPAAVAAVPTAVAAVPTATALALVSTEAATAVPSPSSTLAPTTIAAAPTRLPTPTAAALPPVLYASPTRSPSLPTALPLAAPYLVGPADRSPIHGPRHGVVLSFHGTAPLSPNHWFRIQVDFHDRENRPASWCGWSQSNSIVLPVDYYDDTWQLERTFRWHVNVAAADNYPNTCAAPVLSLSPPSPEWVFYWY